MKAKGAILKSLLAAAAVASLLSCNALVNETQSGSLLIINFIQGTDLEFNRADYLQSDVLYQDSSTGAESIFADTAFVNFSAELVDPNPGVGASAYNDILVTRYVVTFSQPNGAQVEGRDVPFSFEGRMSALVRVGFTHEVGFIIVREVAKTEPPLTHLREGTDVLQVMAQVDFYGKDGAGKSVKATGYLNIFFANYINQ